MSKTEPNIQMLLESLGAGYELILDADVLTVKSLGREFEFILDTEAKDELDDLRNEILVTFKLEEIKELISKSKKEIKLELDKEVDSLRENDECGWGITVECPDWLDKARILFNPEQIDKLETLILRILSLKYIEAEGCYCEDYFELVISFDEWYLDYLKYEIIDSNYENDRINYEVSVISDDFINTININERYDDDYFFPEDLMTLKIQNINKNKNITVDDKDFLDTAYFIAKCIIFDISRKYSINIQLDFANINPLVDPPEGIEDFAQQEAINRSCILANTYDNDLIEYYYDANQMTDSEFKYLAFYRVLECIFDEVYLHETIQDVKQIFTSNWFIPSRNSDVASIIKIVEQYNKNKNDREKLKLVLEKYFKGDNHDEAYLLANQDIISILTNDLKKMKNKEDLKDLLQFASILYDFRCKCTHSNRAFAVKKVYEGTSSELEVYIKLIKKVSERIIVNYGL